MFPSQGPEESNHTFQAKQRKHRTLKNHQGKLDTPTHDHLRRWPLSRPDPDQKGLSQSSPRESTFTPVPIPIYPAIVQTANGMILTVLNQNTKGAVSIRYTVVLQENRIPPPIQTGTCIHDPSIQGPVRQRPASRVPVPESETTVKS